MIAQIYSRNVISGQVSHDTLLTFTELKIKLLFVKQKPYNEYERINQKYSARN